MFLDGPIARGTISTSIVLGIRALVQTGTLLIVARLLGPDDFGTFAGVASLAVVLGTLSAFGMQLVLLREVSRDPTRREEVLARALPVTVSTGTLLLGVFLAACLTVLAGLAVPLPVLLAIGIAETLIQPILALAVRDLTGLGFPARSQLLATLPLTLRLALATVVLWISPPEPLAVYAYAYLGASAAALIVISTSRLSPWRPLACWRWPKRAQLEDSAGLALLSMTSLAPGELDKTLAARLLAAGDSGLYAAAQRAVGAVTLPVSAMMLSALPRLYREGHDQSTRIWRLLAFISGASAAYGMALAAILWLAAPLIESLFGAPYHGIEEAIRWLCAAVPAMSLRITLGSTLLAMGTTRVRVAMELVGLLTLLVAGMILTGTWGTKGMALAFTSSQWAMVATGIIAVGNRRNLGSSSPCVPCPPGSPENPDP